MNELKQVERIDNPKALRRAMAAFRLGRRCYDAEQFSLARKYASDYRLDVDYHEFVQDDRRPAVCGNTLWSVVVVSYNTGKGLLDCLESVFVQINSRFEVVLVDNGNDERIKKKLLSYPILQITPPQNMFPSEARNIGAYFARGRYLAFLDDDGIVSENFLEEGERALSQPKVIGARGRIVPKTESGSSIAHYDLGRQPKSATLTLEGNMVIHRDMFLRVGGFDPLMFGHEGKELGVRLDKVYADCRNLYWPSLEMRHDFASQDRLFAKRRRKAIGVNYINFMKSRIEERGWAESMIDRRTSAAAISSGVSVILRAGEDYEGVRRFLTQFAALNSYSNVEFFVLFDHPERYLDLVVEFSAKVRLAIKGRNGKSMADIAESSRYDLVLLVVNPNCFKKDCLAQLELAVDREREDFVVVSDCDIPESVLLSQRKAVGLNTVRLGAEEWQGLEDLKSNWDLSEVIEADSADRDASTAFLPTDNDSYSLLSSSSVGEPLVSFIVPLFNKEKDIERSLKALLSVEGYASEVVVVDDCSKDESLRIVQDFASGYDNLTILKQSQNKGASAARNLAILYAKGVYMAFVDADDIFHVDSVNSLVPSLKAENWDVVRGKIQGVNPMGEVVPLAKQNLLHKSDSTLSSWLDDESLWFHWYFTAGLYNRSFLQNNMIRFPEGIRNEDPHFFCRVLMAAKSIRLVDNTLYSYCVDTTNDVRSASLSFYEGWSKGYYRIFQMVQAYREPAQYFLCQFPSLLNHSVNVVKAADEVHAKNVLKYIYLMFKNLDRRYVENPKSQPWKNIRWFSREEVSFLKVVWCGDISEVYEYLFDLVKTRENMQ